MAEYGCPAVGHIELLLVSHREDEGILIISIIIGVIPQGFSEATEDPARVLCLDDAQCLLSVVALFVETL